MSPLPARLCLVVFAAGALLGAPDSSAARPEPHNLTRLIAESDQIVAGTVTRVVDGVGAGGLPYTEVTIAVTESVKGELRVGKHHAFRQFGLLEPRKMPDGRVLASVTPEGFPRWREGEQVVAFLARPAARTGLRTTVGLAQGKLTVLDGRAANELGNRGLFEGVNINDDLLTAKEQALLGSQGPVDAATFLDLVGRAVHENWIGRGAMR